MLKKRKTRYYIVMLLLVTSLGGIFLNSFCWPNNEIGKRRLFVWVLTLVGVMAIPILSVQVQCFYRVVDRFARYVTEILEGIKNNRKKSFGFVVMAGITIGLSYVFVLALCIILLHKKFNIRLFFTFMTIVVLGIFVSVMRKKIGRNPELFFAFVALIMGIYCIGVTPNRVGVSWDDEIHYANTLELSDFLNGIKYNADTKNIADYASNIYAHSGYDRETAEKYDEELNVLYNDEEIELRRNNGFGVASVAYVPAAIGIILGRGLGLSYVGVFNLGRFCNLLMYTILITLAIKHVKYGKVLIATIGLIPTTIFMASCYSYDPWVIGFTILGFSYFIAELQDEKPIEIKNIVVMIGAFLLGCLPKAIYFPLLFPLLFLPKKKFKDSRRRKWYYASIMGAGMLLVATFMLPMLINGAGTGDIRGGGDVNSTEQILFILQNPFTYAKNLLNFLRNYIALANSGSMLQKFAYVGDGYYYTIVEIVLVVVAFLDRGKDEKNYCVVKVTGLVGCATAIILATTALYISFTAVGAGTVSGMQARYMLPTVFPALYFIGLNGTNHKIDKNVFVCTPMLIIALTFIFNMFELCVLYY